MANVRTTRRRLFVDLAAAAGAADEHVFGRNASYRAVSVTAHPGGGGSAKIAISCRHPDDIAAGNADWIDVEFGDTVEFSDDEGDALPAAVQAVRLSAVGAPARAHVVAVT